MTSFAITLTDLLKLGLLGGMVAVDTASFLQIMISRPLVAGFLTGWLLGDLPTGCMIGAILELLYLRVLPLGASKYPDAGLATVVSASLAIFSERNLGHFDQYLLVWLILLAMFVGTVGGVSQQLVRRGNRFFSLRSEKAIEDEKFYLINVYHLTACFVDFIRGFGITILFIVCFSFLFSRYAANLTLSENSFLNKNLMWIIYGFAFATGVDLFLNRNVIKHTLSFFLVGFSIALFLSII